MDGPYFNNGVCTINGKMWEASPFMIDEKGNKKKWWIQSKVVFQNMLKVL